VIEEPIGAALNRDISSVEKIEADLDNLIDRRDRERRRREGERDEEAAWKESERRVAKARDTRLRIEWSEYHLNQAKRHRALLGALVAHHEEQARKYAEAKLPPPKANERS
jgi:hypothetical protein